MFCKKCKALINDTYNFCPACGKETNPEPKIKGRRPKGGGCVSKLYGKRNKPFRAIKNGICLGTFESEREASICLLQYQEKNVTSLENITLLELYGKWQQTEWYEKLSKSTKGNYSAVLPRLSDLYNCKIKDLKTSHYQSAIDKAKENGTKQRTFETLKTLISVLCKFAMSDDIISRNYAISLRIPETKSITKRNFTDEEILTLFYNDHDETARIILCLIYTGMREGEFLGMLKKDVFLDKHYMVGGLKTESGKDRAIPIRNEITEYIEHFYNSSTSEYLVHNLKGNKIDKDNFRKLKYYPLLDKLKINYKNEDGKNVLTPHRTRHTFIAENIKAGVKPEILTKIVGHSKYSTSVEKYNKYVDMEYILSQIQRGM